MANVKISQLASAATLTGTEEVAIVQSNTTVKTTAQAIANLGGGGSSFTLTTVGTLGTGSSVMWNAGSKVFASTAAGTQTLSVVSYPVISIGSFGGFSGTLSSITITDLTYLELNIGNINTIVTVDVPGLTTLINTGMFPNLQLQGCPSLTTVNIPALTNIANSLYIAWTGNAFSQATVDHILVKFAATTAINCTLDLSGGTSSTPSATGLAAIATLQGRGWNVTTN